MSRRSRPAGVLFVNILGGLRIAGPRAGDALALERRKTRALLALLAIHPGRLVPRGQLTAQLWSSRMDDSARHGLRQCLFDLRRALAKADVDALRIEGDGIGLDASRVVVDAARFEKLTSQNTVDALNEAMNLYEGDLLEGLRLEESAFEEWLLVHRERLRSRAVEALRKLLAHYRREKVTDAAIQAAVRLLTFEPFDEAVHRALMGLYAESGRRNIALRQYEACVEILSRELGVEPEAETRDLYRRLVAERSPKAPTIARIQRTSTLPIGRPHGAYRSSAGTPLIGREADLAWLEAVWERSRRGEPQMALIVGEAGIGKSRLVDALASHADRRTEGFLLGRGREGEDVLPFAPWIEALRPVLCEPVLEQLPLVTRLDLARLFPEISQGPGPPPTGIEEGPRIFEAVAHLLRLLAIERPLLVVIEDLHWCDDMTVRLLRFLPRRLKSQRVLLVGTARPEELGAGSGRATILSALPREPACASTALGPLSRSEAVELFQTLLALRAADLPPGLAERVWQLSEGNPFVVIECARAVRDHGTATPDVLTQLPDQVRALTDRYLADLGARAARLAAAAAVIGRDFEVQLVCQATGVTQSEAADALEELVLRRVIREVNGRFDFRHDRVREAAYARLLGSRRSLLHRHVAEALEAVYAAQLDPHRAAIGAHYREAGVWDRASTHLARAGFQAWDRGAGREALACFEAALQAIAQLPDDEERRERQVHLCLAANGASVASGSYERGLPHLESAAQLADTLTDRRWRGRVAAVLGNAYRLGDTTDRAHCLAQFSLDVARETGDRGLEAAARTVLAYTEYNKGNFRRSVEVVHWVLSDEACCAGLEGPFLSFVDKPSWMRAFTRYLMIMNYVHLGEFDAGFRLVEQSFQECDPEEDALGTARMLAYMGLGKLELARGDFHAAVRAFEEALAIYREDCHRNFYRPLVWSMGLAYALAGRVAEGVGLLEKAAEAERQLGSRVGREMLLLHTGRPYIEAGRIDGAARCAGEALEWSRKTGRGMSEAGAYGLLGEVAMHQNPVDNAEMERHVRASLALANTLEMRPLAARCHLRLAWLAERTGAPDRERHESDARSLIASMCGVIGLDASGTH